MNYLPEVLGDDNLNAGLADVASQFAALQFWLCVFELLSFSYTFLALQVMALTFSWRWGNKNLKI